MLKLLRSTRPALLFVGVLLLAALAWATVAQGARRGADGPAEVGMVLIGAARPGERITVRVEVSGASNLAGFETTARYDPAVLRLVGAEIAEELARDGRDLFPLGPILQEGQVLLGAATCPVGECAAGYPYAAARQPRGVTGQITLATLTFFAPQPGRYTLALTDVMLVDPDGATVPHHSASPLVIDVQP